MAGMDLGRTERVEKLCDAVRDIVRNEVIPIENEWHAETENAAARWKHTPRQIEILEGLKTKARAQNLWNFWLTKTGLTASDKGYGLTTVEYAYLAEKWAGLISPLKCLTARRPILAIWKSLRNTERKNISRVG